MPKKRKTEWTPENAGDEFTTEVMPGIKEIKSSSDSKRKSRKLSVDDYVEGVLSGNRTMLARAITLVEINSDKHISTAQEVLKKVLPATGNSLRIGITGSPGVGKSTFIESFGSFLCKNGHRVAVLAIDPSSQKTRGSVLGDKTRMEELSRFENAFIRPSAAGGTLGGVARKTRESVLICEAAGYDVILIETVGVGQSEVTVRSMVDFFLLMLLPGGGDELQGIKKGVMELADAIVINKADGDNQTTAKITKQEYQQAVHYIQPATKGWETQVMLASALNNLGIEEIWETIKKFEDKLKDIGGFDDRRQKQTLEWMYSMIEEGLKHKFYQTQKISDELPEIEKNILSGNITPTKAADHLLKSFFQKH
jgi:LAO/AO transport system kinase